MVAIEIVQADLSHLEPLVPLFDAYRQFYRKAANEEGARTFLRDRLSQQDSTIFLARPDTNAEETPALGFVQLYPSFSSTRMRRLWILNDLYVIPTARQQGIGRSLLERARHFGQSTGAVALSLATEITNESAQALYRSVGYEQDTRFLYFDLTL